MLQNDCAVYSGITVRFAADFADVNSYIEEEDNCVSENSILVMIVPFSLFG
jgi:hypothetical protein